MEPDGIDRFNATWDVGLNSNEIPENLNPRFVYKYRASEGSHRRYHRVLEISGVAGRPGAGYRTHYFIFYQRMDDDYALINTKTLKTAVLHHDSDGYYIEETYDWETLN